MRFGVCCSLDDAPIVLNAGFEYVELPAGSLTKERFAGVRVEATNLFFPGDVKLFGPARTPFEPAARAVIEAAAGNGVSVMVLGSGNARRAPEGYDTGEADREFALIAQAISEIAAQVGIRVCPESLNRDETNVGNSLPDLARILATLGVGYTADAYHALRQEAPAVADLEFWRSQLPLAPEHVHLATAARTVPTAGDPALVSFAARLAELEYDGLVSIEARMDGTPDELPKALLAMQQLFVP